VARRVKDIFEISEYTSLDALIEGLVRIRSTFSDGASPSVAIRGDDYFGQRLTITYLRELTKEEADIEKRYTGAASRGRFSRSANRPNYIGPGREAARLRRNSRSPAAPAQH
jgi:hypothetical protein